MSFVRYNPEDSVISAENVTRPMWTNEVYTLNVYYAPIPTDPVWGGEWYLPIYNAPWQNDGSTLQFTVQYGHSKGSGSVLINPVVPGLTPSRAVYGQYRNLVYGTETQDFSFDGGTTVAEQIYVISINRSCYKQSIQPGSLNLTLNHPSASVTNSLSLTDDSNTTSLTRFAGENRIYYIISGSNGTPYTSSAATTYYGMMLPDLGLIILDASGSLGGKYLYTASLATSSVQNNHLIILAALASASSADNTKGFAVASQETVSSRFFFTRVKNNEFNYTSNPSIIDANGNIIYNTLINNPQTYITTVGMYNDNNELLAVAKLSKPLVKDFTKEALIRIKLDY